MKISGDSTVDDRSTTISRRELLAGGGALTLASLAPGLAAAAAAPDAASNEESFRWVQEMYELGRQDRYGYRMPGTKSDHEAAHYLAGKLRQFGLSDVRLESVPIAVAFPDRWNLRVHAEGQTEEVPCSFVRYCRYTPAEGVSAEMVYVGEGSPA